ncbi:transcriptional regulator, RpiR family [Coriobacterium glomerans PW2]|uniref:Transcriptional regulator, RpiR family n=1 Tax=Coriobacterium glomerans (strain ATCC 49209 / DSM 20642 / JCM 10262 / PW2) TaxID=700015 RepID=F2NAX7_CORGP|nr:MurR/RpiR family transcriptional regulator [Coriobacterium glomerans]AEB07655.1 transcriptional regulator, RpiR family [Coriobacterium glomerans PW2]
MQRKGSVINEICTLYDRLSDRERHIADFVLAKQTDVPTMTTREIASESRTSAATVSRFVRHLGYESFSDLRDALLRENGSGAGASMASQVISVDAPRAAMETVLLAKKRELLDTLDLIDEGELVHAVRLIEGAVSIVFAAVGNTIPAGLSASFLLSELGLRAQCAPTTEAMMLSSMSLTGRDVLVFISKSGHSKRLNKMMDNALDSETPTIVITNVPDSPLARRSSCVLHAATRDKVLSGDLPFSHNSINFIVEVIFLLLCSDVPNFKARAGLLWKSLGEDKGVSEEVF